MIARPLSRRQCRILRLSMCDTLILFIGVKAKILNFNDEVFCP